MKLNISHDFFRGQSAVKQEEEKEVIFSQHHELFNYNHICTLQHRFQQRGQPKLEVKEGLSRASDVQLHTWCEKCIHLHYDNDVFNFNVYKYFASSILSNNPP